MRNIMPAALPFARCLALAFLLCATSGAQRAEIVYLNSKGDQKTDAKASITEWTYTGIKFKGKTKRDISPGSLISVKFTRQPVIFEDAMLLMEEGEQRNALPLFLTIIEGKNEEGKDLGNRDIWIQEHALFNAWVISRGIDRLADAKAHREALKKSYPKSHYLPEIEFREAGDLFAFGDFGKSLTAFEAFGARASKLGFGNKYIILAGVGRVRSLIGAGKSSEAETAQSNLSAKALNERTRLRCELLRGDILVAKKKFGAAESLFTEMLKKADFAKQPYIFAGAANGLGDCLYGSAKYKEAMYEYSKTFALLAGQDGLDHENGWAFWRFANCCKQIAAKTEGPEAKVYASRFRKNRDRVAEEYRLSRGGQLARREKGMGK